MEAGKVFLRYEAPRPLTEAEPPLPAVFAQQYDVLTDAPIVTTTDKVLDCVLPPRVFEDEDGNQFVQRVDHQQVSRETLSELRYTFDEKLSEAKARRQGICPVRQAIYAMLFDELVRQVTIDGPERGLLLARVRDEIRMTLDAYTTLYEASVTYSANKMSQATRTLPEMRARMSVLRDETDVLKKELSRLQAKHAAMQRCVEEQQAADHKKHAEERVFLEGLKLRLQKHLDFVKETQENERRKALRALEAE